MMQRRSWRDLAPIYGCLLLGACTMPSAPRPSDLTADARLRVAEAADAAGDDNLAMSMYVTAAEKAPADIAVQLRAADALARSGYLGQAIELLTKRLKAQPGQPDLTRALANIYIISDEPRLGLATLDKVLAVDPSDARALTDKAVALDLEGRHSDAQVIYRQVLAASPDDSATANDLALSLMLEGRLHDARAVLAPFKNAADLPSRVRTTLGLLEAANGNTEEASALLAGQVPTNQAAELAQRIRGSVGSQ
jgi:Flp pilus assembly protein TadD